MGPPRGTLRNSLARYEDADSGTLVVEYMQATPLGIASCSSGSNWGRDEPDRLPGAFG